MANTENPATRYFTAFLIGSAAGLTSAFLAGIILAYINIYLSGNNIRWQDTDFVLGFITLTFIDGLIFMVASLVFFYTFNQYLEECKDAT